MSKILIDEATVKLVLEALKQIDEAMPFPVAKLAQAALREALAKPDFWEGYVPEPVKPRGEATLAQQDIPDLIAGTLGVSRGTAYDMMRETLAEQEPVIVQDGDTLEIETILYTSPPAQRKPLTDTDCTWSRPDSDHMPDTWQADCGAMWTFTDGGPQDNGMNFCPNCGKPAIEAAHNIKEQP